jgi:hypothetical protein
MKQPASTTGRALSFGWARYGLQLDAIDGRWQDGTGQVWLDCCDLTRQQQIHLRFDVLAVLDIIHRNQPVLASPVLRARSRSQIASLGFTGARLGFKCSSVDLV